MRLKKKIVTAVAVVLGIVLVSGVSIYAATNYGTSSDPLVTMSYVNTVKTDIINQAKSYSDLVKQELESGFDQQVESYSADMEALLASSGTSSADVFTVITLSKGQTLLCTAGSEVIHRSGTASVSAGSSFVDSTGGSNAEGGTSVTVNHLYIAVSDNCGVKAGSESVTLLVRGGYSIA